MKFLTPTRKEIIQSFPDKDFRLEVKNTILSIGIPKKLSVNNTLSIAKFLEEI